FFCLLIRRPRRSRFFPYTTLFRSVRYHGEQTMVGHHYPSYVSDYHCGDCDVIGQSGTLTNALDACKAWFCARPGGVSFSLSANRSEEHTSELQSRENLVCRLLLEK